MENLSEISEKLKKLIQELSENSFNKYTQISPSNYRLERLTEPSSAGETGVIMTPEVIQNLKTKQEALAQQRRDLERQRRMDEYDSRAQARRVRVQDTLEKTGLDGR
jgi:hypothetical protein